MTNDVKTSGRVLTNEEIDAIIAEPWTAHLTNYDDIARTLDVLRRSAKAWHRAHEIAVANRTVVLGEDVLLVADGTRGMERGR